MAAIILVPQRYTAISFNEERIKCHLTWEQFDERCWLASLADEDEINYWVADARKFKEKATEIGLVFSDQIPFWIKIGFMKVLYAEFELVVVAKRKKAEGKKRKLKSQHQMCPSCQRASERGHCRF